MKKKILIVSHAMELGGAERSLLGLLEAIDTEKYQVDLFLLRHEGELLSLLPDKVNLLPEIPAYTALARPMVQVLKEGHVLLCAARLFGKVKAFFYNKARHYTESGVALEYSHKYTCPFMPAIVPDTAYDAAISFLTPHYMVAKKVRAKKKIAWIHTDYKMVQVDVQSELKMWGAYNTIVSISDAVAKSFCHVFGKLKDKVVIIENILPQKAIEMQAGESVETGMDDSCIKFLSIGRFCTAKNFDNVPDICRRILQSGLNVKWYLIGFGPDENLIRQKIKEAGMEDRVIILGKRSNPYPYIKYCDLYVQPSRYEGKSVSVREAQMLGKPVVITNYETSASQLDDGVDGLIVPLTNQECSNGIISLLRDKKRTKVLSENCKSRDYTNANEVNLVYQLVEKA